MDKKILDFYAERHLEVSKLIERRPYGITASQVEEAAIKVYEAIQGGLSIPVLKLARHVWEVSRKVSGQQYEQDWKLIREAKTKLAERDKRYLRMAILFQIFCWLYILEAGLRILQGVF